MTWGALIEFQGGLCPLTPLEQKLRQAGGQTGYSGGFIEYYILPILYPDDLNKELQIILGSIVIIINIAVYAWLATRLFVGTQKKAGQ